MSWKLAMRQLRATVDALTPNEAPELRFATQDAGDGAVVMLEEMTHGHRTRLYDWTTEGIATEAYTGNGTARMRASTVLRFMYLLADLASLGRCHEIISSDTQQLSSKLVSPAWFDRSTTGIVGIAGVSAGSPVPLLSDTPGGGAMLGLMLPVSFDLIYC